MDSLETLETLVDQVRRGEEVISSLESISLLADEMKKTAETKNEEATTKEILDNLQGNQISKAATSESPVFLELNETEFNSLKDKIYDNERKEDQLESVGEVNERKFDQRDAIVQKIDSNLLKGSTIMHKKSMESTRLYKLSLGELGLLRQEIVMQKNTVNFKNLMDSIKDEWGISKTNDKLMQIDLKDVLVEKNILNGMQISSKQATKKESFMKKTNEEVLQFKIKLALAIEKIKRSIMLNYGEENNSTELVKSKQV